MEDDFVKLTSDAQYAQSKDRDRVPNVERFIIFEGWFQKRANVPATYVILDNVGHLSFHKDPKSVAENSFNVSTITNLRLPNEKSAELVTASQTVQLRSESMEDILRLVRSVSLVKDRGVVQLTDLSLLSVDDATIRDVASKPAPAAASSAPPRPTTAPPPRAVPPTPDALPVDDEESFHQFSSSWEDYKQRNMLIKTLTKWINLHLKSRSLVVKDLFTDLRDGLLVAALVEVLVGGNCKVENLQTSPQRNVQKMINLNGALKKVRDAGKKFPVIAVEDVMAGKNPATLTLVWSLAWVFDISLRSFQGKRGPTALMLWVQNCLQGNSKNVVVTDWARDFSDGLALCALFYAHDKSAIRFDDLIRHHRIENTRNALNAAERLWQIPKLIDPQDFLDAEVDDKSMILYISACFEHLKDLRWNW